MPGRSRRESLIGFEARRKRRGVGRCEDRSSPWCAHYTRRFGGAQSETVHLQRGRRSAVRLKVTNPRFEGSESTRSTPTPTPKKKARYAGPLVGWGTRMIRPCGPHPCGAAAAARRRSNAARLSNLARGSPLDLQPKRRPALRALLLAGGLGFEPRLTESESAVLPLDDPPGETGSDQRFENWVARRALCRPTFLRSTSRASRVTKPALRSGWRRVSS